MNYVIKIMFVIICSIYLKKLRILREALYGVKKLESFRKVANETCTFPVF